ncbi:MAG: hypothetical protein HDR13_03830 [Lachnospiraceae bacterium]|nr:hypothetical protein [Lachnospiraceae bacterium]
MALDFIIAVLYIGIIYVVGQWTGSKLFLRGQNHNRDIALLSLIIGFSEMTILSTFFYFMCKMPVEAIRAIWLILGIAAAVDVIRRHSITKYSLAALCSVLLLWLFMLVPGLIGKDQYYVYRGNATDSQTYVEETVALSMHPIGWYESRSAEEIGLVSDVLLRGYHWAISDRPSAGLMIAVLRGNPKGEIYWVVYLYRMFVQAMIMTSLLYLFCVVTERGKTISIKQKIIWMLASVFYCIGFWGQIQYDIDAVSQTSSIAVLTALTAVFFQYAIDITDGETKKPEDRGQYLLMILLAAAALALYLESALVHGALYLIIGIFLLVHRRKQLDGKCIARLAGIPVLSMVIFVLMNYRIINFFRGQITSSVSDVRQTWANYFNAWWLGKHGIDEGRITGPVSKVINQILSLSGMYNVTVNYDRYYGVTALILTGIMILIAGLVLFCIVRPFITKWNGAAWILWVMTLTGIVAVLLFCICGKPWSGGKLLYYISPYWYTFLCFPVLQLEECHGISGKLALCVAVVLLCSNAKIVAERAYDVKVNWACIGYRGNYPSDMIPGLKLMAVFELDTRALEGVDSVQIRDLSIISDHQYYLQYVKVKLTCAGITFVPDNDINYYQNPLKISSNRILSGDAAVLEAQQREDGRYEIIVR